MTRHLREQYFCLYQSGIEEIKGVCLSYTYVWLGKIFAQIFPGFARRTVKAAISADDSLSERALEGAEN